MTSIKCFMLQEHLMYYCYMVIKTNKIKYISLPPSDVTVGDAVQKSVVTVNCEVLLCEWGFL